MDEVRRIETRSAVSLANSASLLAALDQTLAAMDLLIARRTEPSADPLIDLALLRFAVAQFVACLRGPRGAPVRSAFSASDARFFEHLSELADQLAGPQARLTGATEVVVLLRRAQQRVGLVGVVTRARRPDRLTAQELGNIAEFMKGAREALAEVTLRRREKVIAEVQALEPGALLALPLADSPD